MSVKPIFTNSSSVNAPSKLVQCLGYAGLLPFVLLALWLCTARVDQQGLAATALTAYGAVIASFLGGVHWGLAAQVPPEHARLHYVWGVTPSLLAWVALLLPGMSGLSMLGAVIAACYAVDRLSYPPAGWAAWLPMRFRLTVVASLSCMLGAAAM